MPSKLTLTTHDGIFYYPKSLKPENNIDIEKTKLESEKETGNGPLKHHI